jgi:Protein of unknown function (DUF3137)
MDYESKLQHLEEKRLRIIKRMKVCAMVFIPIFLLCFLSEELMILIIVGGLSLIISLAVIFDGISQYKKSFKLELMPILVSKVGLDIQYNYKEGISKQQAMQAKLFKRPDRYKCEDLMIGTIDGVKFYSSDVHMEERHVTRDSKGNTRVSYQTYFLGRWFIYDFNKEFKGIIQVREDGFLSGPLWGLGTEKIQLEDVEFNKKFKTYATNQHDAFYVLTPSLMENIKKLEARYPGRIYFSFIGSQLHVAIYNSKDSFEPPIFSPINDLFINTQIQDILIIDNIVQELKLNRKIFKN